MASSLMAHLPFSKQESFSLKIIKLLDEHKKRSHRAKQNVQLQVASELKLFCAIEGNFFVFGSIEYC